MSSWQAKFLAEFLGTLSIVAAVLGAGFMVSKLQVQSGLDLFMIASAVAGVLFVAIATLANISGAHFNPIVTLAFWFRKEFATNQALTYITAQFIGAATGALLANLMFDQPFALSEVNRFSPGALVGEGVASAGLVLLILLLLLFGKSSLIAASVALWIFAGHVFTSSTAFANPAVTFGRIFSSAPSSISADSAIYFIAAQVIGLALALLVFSQLRKERK
jgi:glycerol uptake facilitator-like aquaporin